MIPIIGNICLILSLLLVVLQIIADQKYYKPGAIIVFILLFISFLSLIYCYAISDFSVFNVYKNSHTLKPLLYKITGAWGNHEGSLLLLVLVLSGYNLVFILQKKISLAIGNNIKNTAYLSQLIITTGFLLFIITTSNPFITIYPAPQNGLGLNPLLQDIGLAMHPPMLYLGYIGFSIAFSYSIAALANQQAGANWAIIVKKWVLFSWSILTIGIGLGSWWAYRELGWGGFWFWDPVENASLMPWLSAIALYHALIAVEKKEIFTVWAILISIITFMLTLIGIFLVRSGIISSVHSFANDPMRGIFILCFIAFIGISSFTLFALRANKFINKQNFSVLSKEAFLFINGIFFITLSATVFLGTLYPIFVEIIGDTKVSVGAPYFNSTFNPIAIFMLFFAGLVPLLNHVNKEQIKNNYFKYIITSFGMVTLVILLIYKGVDLLVTLGLSVSLFVIAVSVISIIDPAEKFFLKRLSWRKYSMLIAHSGAAILAIGIIISCSYGVEKEKILKKNERIDFAGYSAQLIDTKDNIGKNYFSRAANFIVYRGEKEVTKLSPEIRLYPVEGSTTAEAAIYYNIFSNIYIAIGEIDEKGEKYATRVYYKPFINLIWFGCIVMAVGGIVRFITSRIYKKCA